MAVLGKPGVPPTQDRRHDMRARETAGQPGLPDIKLSVRQTFGIDSDMEVPAYSKPTEHVPVRTVL